MKKLFPFVAFILLLCAATGLYAQENRQGTDTRPAGIIKGKVTDAASGQPVQFATVTLFRKDSIASGALSAEDGTFTISQLRYGNYKLKISFIGYEDLIKDSILLLPSASPLELPVLKISPKSKLLNAVTVTGEKDFVQIGIDKKIYNVEKNPIGQGGAATDVLQGIPSVAVDVDGNVSLRGSQNVTILIDGKPSGLTGDSRAAILRQIPASSIEHVEVITNPSVKYDPEGMSGIINIVLKKNQTGGFNGLASASAGTGDKYNPAFNMNYRNKIFNVYANYSYRSDNRKMNGENLRENNFADSIFSLNQYTHSLTRRRTNLLKSGADFYLNDKNTLSLGGVYSPRTEEEDEEIRYNNLDSMKILDRLYFRNSRQKETGRNTDVTVDYRKTFSQPQRELTANAYLSDASTDEQKNYTQQDYTLDEIPANTPPLLQQSINNRHNRFVSAQCDYSHPLHEGKSKFETGAKSTFRQIDNNYLWQYADTASPGWINDTGISNHFIYREQIHAAYGTYSSSWKQTGIQLGLRMEKVYTHSELVNSALEHDNNYFSAFPSVHLSEKLGKEQELQLSYSRRVNRPDMQSLNPFPNYNDPLNIRVGNPYLRPEYINSFEMGYVKYRKQLTLNASVYYKQTLNMIQRYRTVDSNGVATVSFVNFSSESSYGTDLMCRLKPMTGWTLTPSFNLYRTSIDANNVLTGLASTSLGWSAKMNADVTTWKNIQLSLSAYYSAPVAFPQGTILPMYSVDVGARKELLKGKWILSANLSDLFNTRRFALRSSGPGYVQYMERKRESRVLTLSLTCLFGRKDNQRRQERRKEDNSEMRNEDF